MNYNTDTVPAPTVRRFALGRDLNHYELSQPFPDGPAVVDYLRTDRCASWAVVVWERDAWQFTWRDGHLVTAGDCTYMSPVGSTPCLTLTREAAKACKLLLSIDHPELADFYRVVELEVIR